MDATTSTTFDFPKQLFLAVAVCCFGWYVLRAADWTLQNVQISLVEEQQHLTEKAEGKPLPVAYSAVPTASEPIGDEGKALAYIEKYAAVAQDEQEKFNIPASITLAQALLESRAGTSKLATTSNNHFGIKCFSKKCKKGHCANFTDDTHKDFFKKYDRVWASYRDHSHFLSQTPRYQNCFRQGNNYRAWAIELEKAGYATDPNYSEALIARIKKFNLDRFDQ